MLIVTEGETDEEFYKKLLNHIKVISKVPRFPFNSIDFVCAKGIGNLQNKIVNIIRSRLFNSEETIETEKTIVLCYDLDVFEYNQNPPIDREQVIKDIKSLGKCKIIKIEAKNMIEDYFLIDFEGIRKYLRLKPNYRLKLSGYEGLKKMFRDGGKTYFKGEKVEGFIEKLNLGKIFSEIKSEIKDFCLALGYGHEI